MSMKMNIEMLHLGGMVELKGLYINMEDGHISFEHNNISSDYIQVIDKL